MLLKNISPSDLVTFKLWSVLLLVAVTILYQSATASTPINSEHDIVVIYPKEGQIVHAKDSTFILGHINNPVELSHYSFYINDFPVSVHQSGGFLAYLPIRHGDFEFVLRLKDKRNFREPARLIRKVTIPEPRQTIKLEDSLVITGDYDPPIGDLSLAVGDMIELSFHGTSGGRAFASIPGLVDSIPMAESDFRPQAFWGESVFGAGAVPDSLKLGGIYTGFWRVPEWARVDNVRPVYHLGPPAPEKIFAELWSGSILWDKRRLAYLVPEDTIRITRAAGYHLTLNDPAFPVTVRFTDSMQTIRHAPRKGYFSIFQPDGVEALAVGQEGGWYKLRITDSQTAFAAEASVEVLDKGISPPRSLLTSVRTYGDDDKVLIEFPLSGKHAFQIIEDDSRTIRVHLFGVTSDTDWIRYAFKEKMIELATWNQPEPNIYEMTIRLNKDIWGYETYYRGNTFYLQINKPPKDVKKLKNKIIVIDPGHSSDPGSIGPTGLTEAEANLMISLALRKRLESKGATVIMTRDDNSNVPLYDRPVIANSVDADLFVSIHNNALPDGVNPFTNNGTSCYYYHPHSIELAREIHGQMIKRTKLPDHGLFHGNLAVNRPTQYPAVLVECAFMIIPEQEALLQTENFQKEVARAISDGIEKFLKNYHERSK